MFFELSQACRTHPCRAMLMQRTCILTCTKCIKCFVPYCASLTKQATLESYITGSISIGFKNLRSLCLSARHTQFFQKSEIFGLVLSPLAAGAKGVKTLVTKLLVLGFEWVIGVQNLLTWELAWKCPLPTLNSCQEMTFLCKKVFKLRLCKNMKLRALIAMIFFSFFLFFFFCRCYSGCHYVWPWVYMASCLYFVLCSPWCCRLKQRDGQWW